MCVGVGRCTPADATGARQMASSRALHLLQRACVCAVTCRAPRCAPELAESPLPVNTIILLHCSASCSSFFSAQASGRLVGEREGLCLLPAPDGRHVQHRISITRHSLCAWGRTLAPRAEAIPTPLFCHVFEPGVAYICMMCNGDAEILIQSPGLAGASSDWRAPDLPSPGGPAACLQLAAHRQSPGPLVVSILSGAAVLCVTRPTRRQECTAARGCKESDGSPEARPERGLSGRRWLWCRPHVRLASPRPHACPGRRPCARRRACVAAAAGAKAKKSAVSHACRVRPSNPWMYKRDSPDNSCHLTGARAARSLRTREGRAQPEHGPSGRAPGYEGPSV
jgi:hypothetical protein